MENRILAEKNINCMNSENRTIEEKEIVNQEKLLIKLKSAEKFFKRKSSELEAVQSELKKSTLSKNDVIETSKENNMKVIDFMHGLNSVEEVINESNNRFEYKTVMTSDKGKATDDLQSKFEIIENDRDEERAEKEVVKEELRVTAERLTAAEAMLKSKDEQLESSNLAYTKELKELHSRLYALNIVLQEKDMLLFERISALSALESDFGIAKMVLQMQLAQKSEELFECKNQWTKEVDSLNCELKCLGANLKDKTVELRNANIAASNGNETEQNRSTELQSAADIEDCQTPTSEMAQPCTIEANCCLLSNQDVLHTKITLLEAMKFGESELQEISMETRLKSAEEELRSCRKSLKRKEMEIEDLKTQLMASDGAINDKLSLDSMMDVVLKSKSEANTALETQLKEAVNDLSRYNKELLDLHDALIMSRDCLTVKELEVQELRHSLNVTLESVKANEASFSSQLLDMQNRLSAAEKDLSEERAANVNAIKLLEGEVVVIEKLQSELEAGEDILRSKELELESVRGDLKELSVIFLSNLEALQACQERLRVRDEEVKGLSSKLLMTNEILMEDRLLESGSNTWNAVEKHLFSSLQEMEAELREKEAYLQTSNKTVAALEDQLTGVTSSLRQHEARLIERDEELAEAARKLSEVQGLLESTEERLRSSDNLVAMKIMELEHTVNRLAAAEDSMKEKDSLLEVELESVRKELEEVKKSLLSTQEALGVRQDFAKESVHQVALLSSTLNKKNEVLASKVIAIHTLEDRLRQATKQLEEEVLAKQTLEEELKSTKVLVKATEEALVIVQSELNESKMALPTQEVLQASDDDDSTKEIEVSELRCLLEITHELPSNVESSFEAGTSLLDATRLEFVALEHENVFDLNKECGSCHLLTDERDEVSCLESATQPASSESKYEMSLELQRQINDREKELWASKEELIGLWKLEVKAEAKDTLHAKIVAAEARVKTKRFELETFQRQLSTLIYNSESTEEPHPTSDCVLEMGGDYEDLSGCELEFVDALGQCDVLLADMEEENAMTTRVLREVHGPTHANEDRLRMAESVLKAKAQQLYSAHSEVAVLEIRLIEREEELAMTTRKLSETQELLESTEDRIRYVESVIFEKVALEKSLARTEDELRSCQNVLILKEMEIHDTLCLLADAADIVTIRETDLGGMKREYPASNEEVSLPINTLRLQVASFLSQFLSTKDAELESVQLELQDMTRNLVSTQEALQERDGELMHFCSELRSTQEILEHKVHQLDAAQLRLQSLEECVAVANEELSTRRDSSYQKNVEIADLLNRIATANELNNENKMIQRVDSRTISSLQTSNESLRLEVATLTSQLLEKKSRVDAVEAERDAERAGRVNVTKTLEGERTAAEEALEAKLKSVEDYVSEKESELDAVRRDCFELLLTAQETLKINQESLREKDRQLHELISQLCSANTAKVMLEEKVALLDDRSSAFARLEEDFLTVKHDLQTQLTQKSEELVEYVDKYEKKVKDLQRDLEASDVLLLDKTTELQSVIDRVNWTEARLNGKDSQLDVVQSELQELKASLLSTQEALQTSQDNLWEREKDVRDLNGTLRCVNTTLKDKEIRVKEMEDELAATTRKLSEVHGLRYATEEKLRSAELFCQDKILENNALRGQLTAFKDKVAEFEDKLLTNRAVFKRTQDLIAAKDEEIGKILSDKLATNELKDVLTAQVLALKNRLEVAEEERDEERAEKASLLKKLEAEVSAKEMLEADHDAAENCWRMCLQGKESELEAVQRELDELKYRSSSVQDVLQGNDGNYMTLGAGESPDATCGLGRVIIAGTSSVGCTRVMSTPSPKQQTVFNGDLKDVDVPVSISTRSVVALENQLMEDSEGVGFGRGKSLKSTSKMPCRFLLSF